MIKKDYAQIKETLYTETLANGLKVYLLPKNDFQKRMACLRPIMVPLTTRSCQLVKRK